MHQIAPFLKIFSGVHAPKPPYQKILNPPPPKYNPRYATEWGTTRHM